MNLCLSLFVVSMAAIAARAENVCSGEGPMVHLFNGRTEETRMPCKYHAVRQQCGKYTINVTPGNIYMHPKYRLNTLWLGIRDDVTGKTWEGRTDNKKSVKYFNGDKNELFTKKRGDLPTEEILEFDRDSNGTWAEAVNHEFRVTFIPWDPDHTTFTTSKWAFQCFADSFEPSGYPNQICGGNKTKRVMTKTRMKELGLNRREEVVYYDVFTNDDITQTNPKCENATRLLLNCTEAQRIVAIQTCSQILSSIKHTKCITKYTCDPMDVFVDCIYWVRSNFTDNIACEHIGQGIDFCRSFKDGNLTEKVKAKKCFKDFISID